jgi:hypothetical protein
VEQAVGAAERVPRRRGGPPPSGRRAATAAMAGGRGGSPSRARATADARGAPRRRRRMPRRRRVPLIHRRPRVGVGYGDRVGHGGERGTRRLRRAVRRLGTAPRSVANSTVQREDAPGARDASSPARRPSRRAASSGPRRKRAGRRTPTRPRRRRSCRRAVRRGGTKRSPRSASTGSPEHQTRPAALRGASGRPSCGTSRPERPPRSRSEPDALVWLATGFPPRDGSRHHASSSASPRDRGMADDGGRVRARRARRPRARWRGRRPARGRSLSSPCTSSDGPAPPRPGQHADGVARRGRRPRAQCR